MILKILISSLHELDDVDKDVLQDADEPDLPPRPPIGEGGGLSAAVAPPVRGVELVRRQEVGLPSEVELEGGGGGGGLLGGVGGSEQEVAVGTELHEEQI